MAIADAGVSQNELEEFHSEKSNIKKIGAKLKKRGATIFHRSNSVIDRSTIDIMEKRASEYSTSLDNNGQINERSEESDDKKEINSKNKLETSLKEENEPLMKNYAVYDPLGLKSTVSLNPEHAQDILPRISINNGKFDPVLFLRTVHNTTTVRDFESSENKIEELLIEKDVEMENLIKSNFHLIVDTHKNITNVINDIANNMGEGKPLEIKLLCDKINATSKRLSKFYIKLSPSIFTFITAVKGLKLINDIDCMVHKSEDFSYLVKKHRYNMALSSLNNFRKRNSATFSSNNNTDNMFNSYLNDFNNMNMKEVFDNMNNTISDLIIDFCINLIECNKTIDDEQAIEMFQTEINFIKALNLDDYDEICIKITDKLIITSLNTIKSSLEKAADTLHEIGCPKNCINYDKYTLFLLILKKRILNIDDVYRTNWLVTYSNTIVQLIKICKNSILKYIKVTNLILSMNIFNEHNSFKKCIENGLERQVHLLENIILSVISLQMGKKICMKGSDSEYIDFVLNDLMHVITTYPKYNFSVESDLMTHLTNSIHELKCYIDTHLSKHNINTQFTGLFTNLSYWINKYMFERLYDAIDVYVDCALNGPDSLDAQDLNLYMGIIKTAIGSLYIINTKLSYNTKLSSNNITKNDECEEPKQSNNHSTYSERDELIESILGRIQYKIIFEVTNVIISMSLLSNEDASTEISEGINRHNMLYSNEREKNLKLHEGNDVNTDELSITLVGAIMESICDEELSKSKDKIDKSGATSIHRYVENLNEISIYNILRAINVTSELIHFTKDIRVKHVIYGHMSNVRKMLDDAAKCILNFLLNVFLSPQFALINDMIDDLILRDDIKCTSEVKLNDISFKCNNIILKIYSFKPLLETMILPNLCHKLIGSIVRRAIELLINKIFNKIDDFSLSGIIQTIIDVNYTKIMLISHTTSKVQEFFLLHIENIYSYAIKKYSNKNFDVDSCKELVDSIVRKSINSRKIQYSVF